MTATRVLSEPIHNPTMVILDGPKPRVPVWRACERCRQRRVKCLHKQPMLPPGGGGTALRPIEGLPPPPPPPFGRIRKPRMLRVREGWEKDLNKTPRKTSRKRKRDCSDEEEEELELTDEESEQDDYDSQEEGEEEEGVEIGTEVGTDVGPGVSGPGTKKQPSPTGAEENPDDENEAQESDADSILSVIVVCPRIDTDEEPESEPETHSPPHASEPCRDLDQPAKSNTPAPRKPRRRTRFSSLEPPVDSSPAVQTVPHPSTARRKSTAQKRRPISPTFLDALLVEHPSLSTQQRRARRVQSDPGNASRKTPGAGGIPITSPLPGLADKRKGKGKRKEEKQKKKIVGRPELESNAEPAMEKQGELAPEQDTENSDSSFERPPQTQDHNRIQSLATTSFSPSPELDFSLAFAPKEVQNSSPEPTACVHRASPSSPASSPLLPPPAPRTPFPLLPRIKERDYPYIPALDPFANLSPDHIASIKRWKDAKRSAYSRFSGPRTYTPLTQHRPTTYNGLVVLPGRMQQETAAPAEDEAERKRGVRRRRRVKKEVSPEL